VQTYSGKDHAGDPLGVADRVFNNHFAAADGTGLFIILGGIIAIRTLVHRKTSFRLL
jgi:hypothetical protein